MNNSIPETDNKSNRLFDLTSKGSYLSTILAVVGMYFGIPMEVALAGGTALVALVPDDCLKLESDDNV